MSGPTSLLTGFADLFEGRLDAYGTDQGGCLKQPGGTHDGYRMRVSDHLFAGSPLGVYPQAPDPLDVGGNGLMVKWGCVDFDEGEEASLAHAINLQSVLNALHGFCYVERSRSKGYHVWVFFDKWTSATVAREALLAACQIAGVPTKEINPKQTHLEPGQVGNYVRLPYPKNHQPGRQVVIDPQTGNEHDVADFVEDAMQHRGSLDLLALRPLYKPPAAPTLRRTIDPFKMESVPLTGELTDKLDGLGYRIYTEGPINDMDRSGTLFKFVRLMREKAKEPITYEEAWIMLQDADVRWGKFEDRPDLLEKLLQDAWR